MLATTSHRSLSLPPAEPTLFHLLYALALGWVRSGTLLCMRVFNNYSLPKRDWTLSFPLVLGTFWCDSLDCPHEAEGHGNWEKSFRDRLAELCAQMGFYFILFFSLQRILGGRFFFLSPSAAFFCCFLRIHALILQVGKALQAFILQAVSLKLHPWFSYGAENTPLVH